jgi:putative transposase
LRGSARTGRVGHPAGSEDERGAGRAEAAPDRGADGTRQSLALACKEAEISEQSDSRWRKEYGGLQVDQTRKMKDLERDNAWLRRLVADLSLDKQVLADAAAGNLFSIRGSSVNALSCASWFDA